MRGGVVEGGSKIERSFLPRLALHGATNSLGYRSAKKWWYSISNLFHYLGSVSMELKAVIKRLKPCTFSWCKSPILLRMNASVGCGMNEINSNGYGRFISIKSGITRAESACYQMLWYAINIFSGMSNYFEHFFSMSRRRMKL